MTIDPKTTALLVMDYQNGIIGMLPNGEALVAQAKRAIAAMRERGAHIGYVRVGFTNEELDALPERSRMRRALQAGRGRFLADAPATQIHDAIAPQAGDIIVRKTRVGPFLTTDLDEQLRARGVTTLILAGISTSGVVLSTVRDAADRDYALYVLADACADPDPDTHACLIEKIFPRQADIIAVDDLSDVTP